MSRIAGLLLLASGGYLFYYWARLRFGDTATVADDPIVSVGVRFSGQARNFADGNGSLILVGAGAIVTLAVFASLWQRRRRAISARLVRQCLVGDDEFAVVGPGRVPVEDEPVEGVLGTQIRPSCCSGVFVDQSAESVASVELVWRAWTDEA